jgi:hypothetical protein
MPFRVWRLASRRCQAIPDKLALAALSAFPGEQKVTSTPKKGKARLASRFDRRSWATAITD